jgi:hypothetical protein
VEKAFERRLEMMCKGYVYESAYEFFIDVYVELFTVVGRAVAPFGVSMATASCVTLEHTLLDWMLRCQLPNIGVGAWDKALAVRD